MKQNRNVFLVYAVFYMLFSCNTHTQLKNKEISLIDEYKKCTAMLSRSSFYWKSDTMGHNGYRSCFYQKIKDYCFPVITGIKMTEFALDLGMGFGDVQKYDGKGHRIYIYYLSRTPPYYHLDAVFRTKLIIIVDMQTDMIIDYSHGIEEY
ncbi:MAG: hypothetical protein EP332_06490 [Bacteroidetes bacterium]|nr:MAG: hypothetical protein EP332_06490 [Bacteroidota bacterium]